MRVFLRREAVPLYQNALLATAEEAIRVPRGDLVLAACDDCGFVFNEAFDAARLEYGPGYDNAQCHSPHFAQYMAGLARELVEAQGVCGSRIVEVGSGKGEFLSLLVADEALGNTGVGFDPSYEGPASKFGGRLRFERRHFDRSCAGVPADVVICRHVIEHVAEPRELLVAVLGALENSPTPRLFFETPCIEWILANRVFWDFYYEHCSLFTAATLRTAFERTGFSVRKVSHVFGGQYLWLEAGRNPRAATPRLDAGRVPALSEEYARIERDLLAGWRERVAGLALRGKVAIWGAGAKGVTFANLVDPEAALIDCVVDLSPAKQGRFVPGTGHAVVGVPALATRGVRKAILMNPNYRRENEALLAAAGSPVELVE